MKFETMHCSRRAFMAGVGATAAATLVEQTWPQTAASSLGEWVDGGEGLPCYAYRGPIRFSDHYQTKPMWGLDGKMLPDDPVFLLGNHRLTLFTHASGHIQILSAERAWARMNQGEAIWSGANRATCVAGDNKHELIGLDEPAAKNADKLFGVGFARYSYQLGPRVKVERSIHVRPSATVGIGSSAFLLRVRFENTGSSPLDVDYVETVLANYRMLPFESIHDSKAPAYAAQPVEHIGQEVLCVCFDAKPRHPLTFASAGQMNPFEQYPPALFVHTTGDPSTQPYEVVETSGLSSIGIRSRLTLKAGDSREISCVFGYTRDASKQAIDSLTQVLRSDTGTKSTSGSVFIEEWRKIVPAFSAETDPQLRREMQWNVAVLEAMASWREYYNETIIPQGCMYDYAWGVFASNRDIAQQALPLCHTNPALARSTLRFILKRTTPDGEVKLMDQGFGWVASTPMQTSDQQLYFFMLLAEYLRVTKDSALLSEQIAYYPVEKSGEDTVLAHIRQAFLFLRDRISVGRHGLVRLWNSDWNDLFYAWETKGSYNFTFETAESCMNTAMAIVILGDLAPLLKDTSGPEGAELTAAMREFRDKLLEAWMRDLGDRAFPRRAWTDSTTSLGEDNLWLEPQGFALLIPEMDTERKRALLAEVQHRVLDSEKMGARQIEKPIVHPGTPQGSRENGGFWYALHGPLVLGTATVDQDLAEIYLKRMTFANYAKSFPEYWTGRWSASDSLDSSLLPSEGLAANIAFCAHAHAWPLYCYIRLREKSKA
jgi:Glycosyl hydrolase 36 superfamily, catalytic domain